MRKSNSCSTILTLVAAVCVLAATSSRQGLLPTASAADASAATMFDDLVGGPVSLTSAAQPHASTPAAAAAAASTQPSAASAAPPNPPHAKSSSKAPSYINMELLLRQIVAECSKKEDTVLQLDPQGRKLVVLPKLPPDAPCPSLDIALRGVERGVGMCTDVALYLMHMGPTGPAVEGRGARIIPLLTAAEMPLYDAKCTHVTARMFLESMYHEWVAPPASGGYHLMQVNSEHMFKEHQPQHKVIDVFLCKTKFCQQLMWQYITQQGWKAEVWYVGHTSSDVLVASGTPRPSTAANTTTTGPVKTSSQPQASSSSSQGVSLTPIHADYNQFLHVKGKSGLKHTNQLLECWAQHPEFPLLTIIGQQISADNAATQQVLRGDIKNVRLLPRPGPAKDGRKMLTLASSSAHHMAGEASGARMGAATRWLSSSNSSSSSVTSDLPGPGSTAGGGSSSSSGSSSAATAAADESSRPAADSFMRDGHAAARHLLSSSPTILDKEQLLSFEDIRLLQANSGAHICASEREGFGHYINEARAAGALVISTDHAPMNELVQDGVSGVLIKPSRTGSYLEWQALGDFSPINAFLEPADICAAVQRVLAMPLQQRQQLGLQARKQYLQEKSIFVHKMRVLRKVLHRRRVERKEAQANKVVADSNGVCCGCSPPVE